MKGFKPTDAWTLIFEELKFRGLSKKDLLLFLDVKEEIFDSQGYAHFPITDDVATIIEEHLDIPYRLLLKLDKEFQKEKEIWDLD